MTCVSRTDPTSHLLRCNNGSVSRATRVVEVLVAFNPEQAGSAVTLSDSGAFTSASSGYAALDRGALGLVSEGSPTWSVLMMPLQLGGFRGVVGLDKAGHVVWAADLSPALGECQITAIDQVGDEWVRTRARAVVRARMSECASERASAQAGSEARRPPSRRNHGERRKSPSPPPPPPCTPASTHSQES